MSSSEPLSSTSAWIPDDAHSIRPQHSSDLSDPEFVSGIGSLLPSAQGGNSRNGHPDPPAHGHEERQPGEGAEEPNETALLLPDPRPSPPPSTPPSPPPSTPPSPRPSTTHQETNPRHSFEQRDQKSKRSYKWCMVLLIPVLAIGGISTALGIQCWSPHTPDVSNETKVISENSTVSLGYLPYDRVNITAQDPNEYHHTTEIYQLSCGAITNQTSHMHTCTNHSYPVAKAFSLDFQAFIYAVRDSVWESEVSVTSAPNGSRIVIALFDNQSDSDAFKSNKTVSDALFKEPLTVLENETTFPPLSFTVPVDSYIFPDASVSAGMNISICTNVTLISYIKPQTSAVCTIQSSTYYCVINISRDTCLFAYTDVEEIKQESDLILILQGTREATNPCYCTVLYVFFAVFWVLLFILIILCTIYLCWSKKCHCSTQRNGIASDMMVYI